MKQLVMLVSASLMALMLSACGEDKPKQPEVRNETTVVQPHEKAMDAEKTAEPAAAPEHSEE